MTDKMINPHNPDFLTKKPWYLSNEEAQAAEPTLEHQQKAVHNEPISLQASEALVQRQRKTASQDFAKGQWIEALKHNKKPYRICQIVKCHNSKKYDLQFEDGTLERQVPERRMRQTQQGARAKTAPNESYDSKRDAYLGYDAEAHARKLHEQYAQREALRQQHREQNQQPKDDSDDGENDDFVQGDDQDKIMATRVARQGGVGGAELKMTARNLRIREDTAKYLRNLDTESAYYDPKSRSMRDNPNPNVDPTQTAFAGDNFGRISGDAVQLAQTQLFAWEAQEQGLEVHPQANPSQAELLKKQYQTKSKDLVQKKHKELLDKYGGSEYLDGSDGLAASKKSTAEDAAARKIRFGVSVQQKEYVSDGRVKSGTEKVQRQAIPSKYEEDIYINGHTTVWGSYFHKGAFQWGYADDHSLMKQSYCTGENGRMANDEANEMRYGTGQAGSAALAQARGMLKAMPKESQSGGSSTQPTSRSKLYGEADVKANLDNDKVKEALKKLDKDETGDDRKRKYHSMNVEMEMTEEEMEAYRLKKERSSDPMSKIDSDKVLDYR